MSILPARVLGGAVLVEARSVLWGASKVYFGVDLGVPHGVRAAAEGSYRRAPAVEPIPVVVRELGELADDEPEVERLFEEATRARHQMTGSPTPRLLHTFGRGTRVLASVEELVVGVSLAEVLVALRGSGGRMPVEVALAIGQGLLPLWILATSASPSIRLFVDPGTVLFDAAGRVRVNPEYGQDRARQVVGAALFLLSAPVSYGAPEQIMGAEPDGKSGMFTLGLLLYQMIAGAHPVASTDTTMFEILSGIALHDAPPLQERRPGLHPGVIELVHRCLARDPGHRFASWHALGRTLAAVQALFPPTGPAEIAACVEGLVPPDRRPTPPRIAAPDTWRVLPGAGYDAVALPAADRSQAWTSARALPVLDPDAVYAGTDARPMYAVSATLLVDARPVTRAELERFFIATRTPPPARMGALSEVTEDDACTLVTAEEAEAYARWAGKRLPTEAEWDAAVAALGAERLGTGEVWEWLSTPHAQEGRVVRGGRWRDQATRPPRPRNRSFATSPAADLGFRCVAGR